MAIQKFNVSADIQEGRWVINFAQALGIFRFVPCKQADSGSLRLGQFLGGGAHWLAGMDGLGHGCWEAVGLQLGERCVENGFGAAQCAEEFSGHARAEAGRQSESQPSQVLVGSHRSCGQRTWVLPYVSSNEDVTY